MKKIDDYLHLYFGCEVQITWYYASNGLLHAQFTDPIDPEFLKNKGNPHHPNIGKVEFKLLLRPLDTMTEEEAWVGWSFVTDPHYTAVTNPKYALQNGNLSIPTPQWANVTRWMLSKHFDIFGLIEAGLALDSTKIIK